MTPLERLEAAYEDAVRVYREDGGDYNAGRVDGLKQALELIEAEAVKPRK